VLVVDDTVDNLSIDEILDSIKKYVSSSENASERAKQWEETSDNIVHGDVEAIRLPPAFDNEDAVEDATSASKNYEEISMPTFIQKAAGYVKPQTGGAELGEGVAPAVEPEPVEKGKGRVEEVLRGFINDVNGIVTASSNSNPRVGSSLDDLVVAEIKRAVTLWIDENMRAVVEETVERELKSITAKLIQLQSH
jgi:cell pole-organizing protein PopZ